MTEWSEKAANFNELRREEVRHWRIVPSWEGQVVAVRDVFPLEAWTPEEAGTVMVAMVPTMRLQSRDEALRYIDNVATGYALSRWKERE